MKLWPTTLSVLCLSPAVLLAAIDGTVVNKTSGKPQAGISVILIKPGTGGMQTLGTTSSDASGRFSFANDTPGGGPQLLQASYKGVNYNKLLTPASPTSGVELDIFDSTPSPAAVQVEQHMVLFEPNMSQLAVNETVIVRNDSTTTYNNPELGGLQFYLPPAANGQVRINAEGPGGMPLPRPAEKTRENDIFKIDFPIKPGQSQFEISYVLPVGSPVSFQGQVVKIKGMSAGPIRLVAPPGVTLSGKDVEQIGTEPKTQATIYNLTASKSYAVDVAGIGSLHGPEEAAASSDRESPPLTQGRPQIYAHMGWLIGITFSILAVGFVMLFYSSPLSSRGGR